MHSVLGPRGIQLKVPFLLEKNCKRLRPVHTVSCPPQPVAAHLSSPHGQVMGSEGGRYTSWTPRNLVDSWNIAEVQVVHRIRQTVSTQYELLFIPSVLWYFLCAPKYTM